jgi:hypothetical protein
MLLAEPSLDRLPLQADRGDDLPMRPDPAINAWFLHPGMLDALLYGTRRARLRAGALQRVRGDVETYARDLEDWLAEHDVPPLRRALLEGACGPGDLVTAEMSWRWSEVARERARAHAGEEIRSRFEAHLHDDNADPVSIHGSFDPAKLTCSTANVELAGTREQWILGQVATISRHDVELRPLAIATLLLAPPPGQWAPDWQRIHPRQVDQWAQIDWDLDVAEERIARLRTVPERQVKAALAALIGEPVVPADWGGEINDLYTSRLVVGGRQHSAAFLLKGPARFSPMTIGHLGKNGDQLTRLGTSPAEVLVLQHCHYIRPEVISYLQDVASNFRHVRRYLVLDGPDTYRLLSGSGQL